jgi:transcriptional regulator with XRE-family HTH domain
LIVTGEQLRGARAMVRMEQSDLAAKANVSVDTVKRLERTVGPISANVATMAAIVSVLEGAGVAFTNGGEPGVKLRKITMTREQFEAPIDRFIQKGLPGIQASGGPVQPFDMKNEDGVYRARLLSSGELIGSITFDGDGPVYDPPLLAGAYRGDQLPIQEDIQNWLGACWYRYSSQPKPIPPSFGGAKGPHE